MCSPVVCCCFEVSVTEGEVVVNSPVPLTTVPVERGREMGETKREGSEGGRKMKCHKKETRVTHLHVYTLHIV